MSFQMGTIEIASRSSLGFQDEDFKGYFVLIDSQPVLQLHLYERYYTLFWLGHAALDTLSGYLTEAVLEISKAMDLPLGKINRGVASYWCEGNEVRGFTHLPFVIAPKNDEEEKIRDRHIEFTREAGHLVKFARFDVDGELPIILWAKAMNRNPEEVREVDSERPEIGFSTTAPLPGAVFNLFRNSCFVAVDGQHVQEIQYRLHQLL